MPIWKNRNKYIKIYKPDGQKYANGRGKTFKEAIDDAKENFYEEFHYLPYQINTVIEIIGVTKEWAATFTEFLEPKETIKFTEKD